MHWRGPPDCAQSEGVLAETRVLLGGDGSQRLPVDVDVELRAAADGGLDLAFEARSQERVVRRELALSSCEEAKQAAALLVALTLDPKLPGAPPAATAAPSSAARQPKREVEANRTPEPEAFAFEPKGGSIGIAAGPDPWSLPAPTGIATARLAWRFGALTLEASGSFWLPTRDAMSNNVELDVDLYGVAAGACYWLTFSAWELGSSLGFELSSVRVSLNGARAGAAAWARVWLGPRIALWVSDEVSLGLSAEAVVALHRPRFSGAQGESTRTPGAGFVPRLWLSWTPS